MPPPLAYERSMVEDTKKAEVKLSLFLYFRQLPCLIRPYCTLECQLNLFLLSSLGYW